jgi:Spy/CpxP family protein refolding chaperone
MNVRRWRIVALACALAATLTARAAAGPPDGGPGHRGPHGPPPVEILGAEAERLGLDQDTRTHIRAIVEESRAEADALRRQTGEAREEMRRLLSSPEVEESAVMKQAETVGALELEEHKNWLRAMLRIRALLTPEQRQKLIELREELAASVFDAARGACKADIDRLCGDAVDARQSRECMRRRRDEVSRPCREAIASEFAKRRPPR